MRISQWHNGVVVQIVAATRNRIPLLQVLGDTAAAKWIRLVEVRMKKSPGFSTHWLPFCVCWVFCAAVFTAQASDTVSGDPGFQNWIKTFRHEAVSQGVRAQVYDEAFRDVRDTDALVLEKAHYQPEFKAEVWEYMDNRIQERAISNGRAMLKQYGPLLERIERESGVSRYVLLAIWSMESNYGAVLQDKTKLFYIPRALATLAYADPSRASFARSQLIAALKILQNGDVSQADFMGSWAGAMGQTQFIPTSYLIYAVDEDGDGKRDIWHSVPDALATAAQLLKKNGWRSGEAWGYEVILPKGQVSNESQRTLAEWEKSGVRRADKKSFPDGGRNGVLKVFQGEQGPAFLMMKNFFVIKSYNNADKYALAVALLADQIAGKPAPLRDWVRPYTRLSQSEKEELQRLLAQKGFYSGVVDGLIGDESRKSIKRFQASIGSEETGYPSKEVLNQLSKK
jgi:membrane-bound lytic murein transglycosylase B